MAKTGPNIGRYYQSASNMNIVSDNTPEDAYEQNFTEEVAPVT